MGLLFQQSNCLQCISLPSDIKCKFTYFSIVFSLTVKSELISVAKLSNTFKLIFGFFHISFFQQRFHELSRWFMFDQGKVVIAWQIHSE